MHEADRDDHAGSGCEPEPESVAFSEPPSGGRLLINLRKGGEVLEPGIPRSIADLGSLIRQQAVGIVHASKDESPGVALARLDHVARDEGVQRFGDMLRHERGRVVIGEQDSPERRLLAGAQRQVHATNLLPRPYERDQRSATVDGPGHGSQRVVPVSSMNWYIWNHSPFSSRTSFLARAQTIPLPLPISSVRLSAA